MAMVLCDAMCLCHTVAVKALLSRVTACNPLVCSLGTNRLTHDHPDKTTSTFTLADALLGKN